VSADDIGDRFDRLDAFIARGALVRHEWGDGQERACLLLAIAPEVGAGNVAACPAAVLPRWLAQLAPSIDDNGTAVAWPAMVRRFSAVVRRGAERRDPAVWRRVLARFMIATMGEAGVRDTSGSCERVAALWRRVIDGDEPTATEWAASGAAAWAAEARAEVGATWDRLTTALLDAIELEAA
jgi:hypothetical protein